MIVCKLTISAPPHPLPYFLGGINTDFAKGYYDLSWTSGIYEDKAVTGMLNPTTGKFPWKVKATEMDISLRIWFNFPQIFPCLFLGVYDIANVTFAFNEPVDAVAV